MATTTLNSVTKIPKMELSSSSSLVSMPVIGFGTAADNNDGATLISVVLESIKLGYRHFDTASAYGSEQALGEAIAEALRLGLIPSWDDLFITTKLWPSEAHAHLVLPSLQKSLRTLCQWTSSLCGQPWKSARDLALPSPLESATSLVEMNPVWQQKKLTEFCKANGIIVTAFSPLGAKGSSWGTNDVVDNEVLKEIAKTHGKTVAQVCLRWVYEHGAAPIAKSYNKERLKENLQIFDWELSEDEYYKIGQIKQHRMMLKEELVSAHGPYKSIEEMWDGEL
uniref:NADP-dependent oxidoreductase domain-containing protein n=1 Tax=Quercus lobata TaxID=97700 RepID=A0A7N2L785_QUELO